MKGTKTKNGHKSSRGKGRKSKRGKRRNGGLGGFGSMATSYPQVARVGNEALNALGVIGGLAAGNMINKGVNMVVDKFMPMTEEQRSSGKFHWKKLVAPLGTFAAGAGVTAIGHALGATEGKNHTIHGSVTKHIGYGILGAGAYHGVKSVLDKDIFAGLGNSNADEAKFFTESSNMLKELVAKNPDFSPELEGLGAENVMTTLRNDGTDTII